MRPRFDYGEAVRVIRNLRNDGTYPGMDTGTLLVRRGSTGYVRDVGSFLQDQIVYSVHFLGADRLVGCREEELQPASEPWTPSRFEFRDQVTARLALGKGGRVLVEQGEVGEILKVLRGAPNADGSPGNVAYHVLFSGRGTLQVPESALEQASSPIPRGQTHAATGHPSDTNGIEPGRIATDHHSDPQDDAA